MEQTISTRFANLINKGLDKELETRKAKNSKESRARCVFSVRNVFNAAKRAAVQEYADSLNDNKTLTEAQKTAFINAYADGIAMDLVVKQAKDKYTFAEINLYENGVGNTLTMSQRSAMTQDDFDSLKDVEDVNDFKGTAGIAEVLLKDGTIVTRRSFKWDVIIADGLETKPDGPVLKFHEDSGAYDDPIYDPSAVVAEAVEE